MRVSTPVAVALAMCSFPPGLVAQELPKSGVFGLDLVYATSPSGQSQLYAVNVASGLAPIPAGAPVPAVPSRWAHRRRTMGALETSMAYAPPLELITPMGDAVGNGALHLVDARTGWPPASVLAPTGNPAAYDVMLVEALRYAFVAADDGAGGTELRGFSFATPGQLLPLSPPALTLSGAPAAYVNRMLFDAATSTLHVPTITGIHVLQIEASVPQMAPSVFVSSVQFAPATNPTSFTVSAGERFVIGTFTGAPTEAGFLAWTAAGTSWSGSFGTVPTAPSKKWVPAVGAEELAVVSDGTNAWAYFLLREPGPGTFFVKPSAVGVVRSLGNANPVPRTILCPDLCGEPFSIPSAHGTRVAFQSSMGPPFLFTPPGGAERINILYSPLDPLGAGSGDGVIATPGPLGGRVSVKGMDRPLWSRDGRQVIAATSHFPGAPNPGVPGIEVLDVPPDVLLTESSSPHTVVVNTNSPNQSIVFPSTFEPRIAGPAAFLNGMSFAGNVFNDGLAAVTLIAPFGSFGQLQIQAPLFNPSSAIPDFPSILPATFDDTVNPAVPIPASFGARRTSFDLVPGFGLQGLTMIAALDDRLYVQPTGNNFLASIGLAINASPLPIALPSGWITTTEILSL